MDESTSSLGSGTPATVSSGRHIEETAGRRQAIALVQEYHRHASLRNIGMANVKTRQTGASVTAFLNALDDPGQRADARKLSAMMRAATGSRPKMWGTSIVGFGSYRYRYASGREGDWPLVGYSPRKQNLSLYIMPGFERFDALLKQLGKFRTGKSCLYIKRLADVDEKVLDRLIRESVAYMREKHETSPRQ